MKNIEELLFLQSLPNTGKATIYKNYISLLPESDGVDSLAEMIGIDVGYISRIREDISVRMDMLLSRPDLTTVTVMDNEYPDALHDLGDHKPLILYVRGDASLLSSQGIAVIGTRKPSPHTRRIEPGLVKNIIEFTGDTIISGLAAGCDYITHDTAMEHQGRTIAVLPGGIDKIYPVENTDLAEMIVMTGNCLVSEYWMDRPANRYSFVERDGIIAALSHTVIAVECRKYSGTMQTVRAAASMGRKLRCYMPKSMSAGDYSDNAYMIRELCAVAVRNTEGLRTILESIPFP